jgi:hypothetical protein
MQRQSIVLCLTLLLLVAAAGLSAQDGPIVGNTAPGFSLPAIGGEAVSLEDLRGRIIILHFGAGW